MGNCSSEPSGKPQGGAAPESGGGGGAFGAPVRRQEPEEATGVPDMELYNSLPPCEVAADIKGLHPVYEGRQEGVEILKTLYVSLQGLCDTPSAQHNIQVADLHKDAMALRVTKWAGYKTDANNTAQQTADPSSSRTSQELTVALQYIEAMLGGVPRHGGQPQPPVQDI